VCKRLKRVDCIDDDDEDEDEEDEDDDGDLELGWGMCVCGGEKQTWLWKMNKNDQAADGHMAIRAAAVDDHKSTNHLSHESTDQADSYTPVQYVQCVAQSITPAPLVRNAHCIHHPPPMHSKYFGAASGPDVSLEQPRGAVN
jgi:hypothetical protein